MITPKTYKRTCLAPKCKVKYESTNPVCSYECASAYSTYLRERNEKKEGVQRRRKIKVMKENNMSYSKWQARLQPEVNHIARLIDYGQPCISCGLYTGKLNGGHYHSQGGNAMIRFNLHNIFLQNFFCNHHKGANIKGFNKGLIKTYGKEYHEYVEYTLVREYKSVKPSIPELQEAIKTARAIVRRMISNPCIRKPLRRIELRRELNIEIGIYPE